ncbi:hypothetical protein H0O02_00940, partial [Candidatus Micrarchaeota archaeon]|nr:hypothetical protein [Candidatus Micrarchaeota archaeon]
EEIPPVAPVVEPEPQPPAETHEETTEAPPEEVTPPVEEPESVVEPEVVEEETTEGVDSGAVGTTDTGAKAEETPQEGGLGWEMILLGLVVIVIIAGAAYWFLMHGSKKR